MTRDEQANYRQRLLEMAERLKSDEEGVVSDALRQAGGGASGNLSNVPMHLADFGTDTFEQEMSASLLTNARQLQSEVAAALDRIEQEKFGQCEQCGRDIGEGRLQAVPYTRYCVDCAQSAENDGEVGFQPTLL
ncbi:MAG TPA: TraR/DksA family transcriptional regulator [Gemmataceae bacterium]|nr:TraR/DksA family transcriptional regulator [Gemmataceae bacterium]